MSVHSYKSLVATLGREQSSLVEAIYASSNLSDEEKITLEARASNLERSFNFVLRKLAV